MSFLSCLSWTGIHNKYAVANVTFMLVLEWNQSLILCCFCPRLHCILLSGSTGHSMGLGSSISLKISALVSWRLHDNNGRMYWAHGILLTSIYEKLQVSALQWSDVVMSERNPSALVTGLPSALWCNFIFCAGTMSASPATACRVCILLFLNRDSETIAIV